MEQLSKSQLACMAAREWVNNYSNRQGKRNEAERGRTSKILAKKFNVSAHYVALAKKILDTDKDLFEKMESGEQAIPYKEIMNKEKNKMSYTLYKSYDSDGNLLYVGKTIRIEERFKNHLDFSGWANEFSYMSVDRFSSSEELDVAEKEAIKSENPKYNIIGK